MECTTCNGTRTVSVERQQTRTMRIYRNANGFNCWPHEAVTSEIERFPTGRLVTYLARCTDCNGTGAIAVSDGTGCIDFERCECVEAPAATVAAPLTSELVEVVF